jgi:hypothetical protein
MNERTEHFQRWTIYYNLQMGVCTGTTKINSHIIYKICTGGRRRLGDIINKSKQQPVI